MREGGRGNKKSDRETWQLFYFIIIAFLSVNFKHLFSFKLGLRLGLLLLSIEFIVLTVQYTFWGNPNYTSRALEP